MSTNWSIIYDEFKELYPELWRRGTTYSPSGYNAIEVRIPSVGIYKYDYSDGQLYCLEKWMDKEEMKIHKQIHRASAGDWFRKTVETYLHTNDLTHQEFADRVGISRQILSKYLNGSATPKMNTMSRICETININLDERI